MFFFKKNHHPPTPFVWKEGEGYRTVYKEFRYFHGLTREWGKITTCLDGTLEWHYVYYHPFRTFQSVTGSCIEVDVREKGLPIWFIHRLQRAALDWKYGNEKETHVNP